jgi:hypothetical protein
MLTMLSKLAMYLMVVTALPGCDSSGGAPPVTKETVVGKWVHGAGAVATTYELRPDGTVTKSVKTAQDLPSVDPMEGTWELKDDWKLVMKFGGIEETRQVIVSNSQLTFAGDTRQTFYHTR